MRFLVDTHLLLWSAEGSDNLSNAARNLLSDAANEIFFSTVSIWEAAIKFGLGRPDFPVAPDSLRSNLLRAGYQELLISSGHAIAVASLPLLHRDPFDRLLVTQARAEGLVLLTADATLARYPGVRRV